MGEIARVDASTIEAKWGGFFDGLQKIEDYFGEIGQIIPNLSDSQLIMLYQYLATIGKSAWKAQCAIVSEAQDRAKFGDHAVEEIAQSFGISRAQAFKDAKIYKVFLATGEDFDLEDKTFFQLALDASAPVEALRYAEEQRQALGKYSTREFMRWIKSSQVSVEAGLSMNYTIFPPYRNEAYLRYIRSLPCCVTRKPGPNEAHHIQAGGAGMKCSDYLTIPLSSEIHREITAIGGGKDVLTTKYNIDPEAVALRCVVEFVDNLKR